MVAEEVATYMLAAIGTTCVGSIVAVSKSTTAGSPVLTLPVVASEPLPAAPNVNQNDESGPADRSNGSPTHRWRNPQ